LNNCSTFNFLFIGLYGANKLKMFTILVLKCTEICFKDSN